MKLFCFAVCLFYSFILPPSSIYDIETRAVDGKTISFSSFRGSKILIAEFNAASPDKNFLLNLEAIKNGAKNLYLIAVPATDFDGTTTVASLLQLKADLKLSYDIAEPVEVKKTGTSKQSSLFKWLTHAENNSHFDSDVDSDQHIYVISEKGTLYSTIGKGTPRKMIDQVIAQNINE